MLGLGRHGGRECVEEDMSKLKLCVKDTQDRAVWRNGILGNRLTRAVARKTTLNDDDVGARILLSRNQELGPMM